MSDMTCPGVQEALFLASDGTVYPESLVCSGRVLLDFSGTPCEHSTNGRMPELVVLDTSLPTYTPDKGDQGDLIPLCAKQHLSSLGHWDDKGLYPQQLHQLRLFKCRMWLWFVIPGLCDQSAGKLSN